MATTPVQTAPTCAKPLQGNFAHAIAALDDAREKIYQAESLVSMMAESKDLELYVKAAMFGLHDLLASIRNDAAQDIERLTAGSA